MRRTRLGDAGAARRTHASAAQTPAQTEIPHSYECSYAAEARRIIGRAKWRFSRVISNPS